MDRKKIKSDYAWLGFSFFLFVIALEVSSYFILFLIRKNNIDFQNNSWLTFILGLAPIWAVGFPVCLAVISRLKSKKPEENKIEVKSMFKFYFVVAFVMMASNILGLIITAIIEKAAGITIENLTIDLISKQKILPSIIFAVILGPIFEELAFRKVIIDKLGQYSKKYTILLSGIMFGLFHTNLHQFFYATAIGIVFAYVYTISGKIRYSIILHSTVNFISGILPMAIIKHLDLEAIQKVAEADPADQAAQQAALAMYSEPAFLGFLGYLAMMGLILLIGFILFFDFIKNLKVDDTESPLKGKGAGRTAFFNWGIILFIIISVAVTVVEIIGMNR